MARMSPKEQEKDRESFMEKHARVTEEFENAQAKNRGQRAYYRGSPSSPSRKRATAKKMGSR